MVIVKKSSKKHGIRWRQVNRGDIRDEVRL